MSIPPIPPWSIMNFRECVQALAWRICGRLRYLESTNEARRRQVLKLQEENSKLRRLMRISPKGEIPNPPDPEYPDGTCLPTCDRYECKGKCGCKACDNAYMDSLEWN